MKRLSEREEYLMDLFWNYGPMTVNEILERIPGPRPHVNTVSTQVRLLEANGFLGHEKEGGAFRYHALIERREYGGTFIGRLVDRCFGHTYIDAVSALVDDKKISVDELKDLIRKIEERKGNR